MRRTRPDLKRHKRSRGNREGTFDDVPFGGYKQSGWGHEFGREGIETYMQTKTVWAQLQPQNEVAATLSPGFAQGLAACAV